MTHSKPQVESSKLDTPNGNQFANSNASKSIAEPYSYVNLGSVDEELVCAICFMPYVLPTSFSLSYFSLLFLY
jgi:hypothetical protein